MAEKYLCRLCSKTITATKNQRYRSHSDGEGEPCGNSSDVIPEDLLAEGAVEKGTDPAVPVEGQDFVTCPECRRAVKLTRNGYYEDHDVTLRGGTRCPQAGTRKRPLAALVASQESTGSSGTTPIASRPKEDVLLPGDSLPERGMAAARPKQGESDSGYALDLAREKLKAAHPTAARNLERQPMEPSPVSTATSTGWDESWAPSEPPTTDESSNASASWPSGPIRQPGSPFRQPPEYVEHVPEVVIQQPPEYVAVKPEKMDGEAALLASRVKETFYAYSNRKTTDNRGAQTTLGPSEVGTPCDRRLAMELMAVPYVNPGGDGWASFVGTCGHKGMAEIYEWADAGSGRYAVEIPLTFGSIVMPRGTSDLLDRREGQIVDWKFMGEYALKKFRLEGASDTYRVQGQTYGYGAELQGEKVKTVAIVGLPRAGSSLDEMHAQVMKYDKKTALAAVARVERIHAEAYALGTGPQTKLEVAQQFEAADDCRYCPFFLKGDKEMLKGCPGK